MNSNIRVKVYLETQTDVINFVELCEKMPFTIYLEDRCFLYRVSAKSTLGVILAKTEWGEVYCRAICNDEKWVNYFESGLKKIGVV